MTRLECRDAKHDKFWEGSVAGPVLNVRFGRIGTDGQIKAKKLASAEAARAELAKVIREKLAKGYVRAGSGSTKKAAPKKASAKSAALRELVAILAPKDAKVAQQVALACDAPDAYAKRFAEALADRNAQNDPVDPWLALVSAVTDERVWLACGLDWKFAAEDIHWNLARVVAAQAKLRKDAKLYDSKKLFDFYDEDEHLLTKTLDFIRLCGRAFSAHGLALVELDIESDSYELTLIPWKDLARAQRLAKIGGGALVLHAPKVPLAGALPKVAPQPKASAKLDKRRYGWEVRADDFEQTPGFLHFKDSVSAPVTTLIDCGSWPPKKIVIGQDQLSVIVRETDGARIVHRVFYKIENEAYLPRPNGTLRIERPGKPPVELLARLPDDFGIEDGVWIGDLVVLIPDEPTVRGRKTRRPLVWNGKTLVPAKGLPDATAKKGTPKDRWPSFLRHGHARTGDGVDVLIWEGAGWIAKGDRFVKTWKLTPDPSVWGCGPIIGAPAPGSGFFYAARLSKKQSGIATIRHAENGQCSERLRFAHVIDGPLRGVRDGRVIFGLNRYANAKTPALGVFHPATNELTFVPARTLGFRKDDQADAYGVSTPKSGASFLWVLDDQQVRRIAWDAILALPRQSIRGGRR